MQNMKDSNHCFSKRPNEGNEQNGVNKDMAIKLLSQYVAELRAGKHPRIEEYVKLFAGPGRGDFESDLRFALNLEQACTHLREKTQKMLTAKRVEDTSKVVLRRILKECCKE